MVERRRWSRLPLPDCSDARHARFATSCGTTPPRSVDHETAGFRRNQTRTASVCLSTMSTALRFTRAAFGAVQRASPGLAARWAERLFCSPPRRPISERMAAWLAGGRRFDLTVRGRRVAAAPPVDHAHAGAPD